mgnify:CR=1 FL=1
MHRGSLIQSTGAPAGTGAPAPVTPVSADDGIHGQCRMALFLEPRQDFLLGDAHGFIGGYPTSRHSLSCAVIAQDGDDMQRDYWYTSARDPADLDDPVVVGETAAKRTIGRLDSRKLKTTRAPVLFTPELARGFVGHAIGAIATLDEPALVAAITARGRPKSSSQRRSS